MKGYSKKLSDVYVLPLPYLVKELPPLIPHNPLSVVMYVWALLAKPGPDQHIHHGELLSPTSCSGVRISDPTSMMELWQQGFFGKGTLSRSEPSWFGRTSRRLGLDGGELTLEEFTEMRRAKRRAFKKERDLAQQQELAARMQAEGKSLPDKLRKALETDIQSEENVETKVREEDKLLVYGNTIDRVEYLHLDPCEAAFLSLGLGVLRIDNVASLPDLLQGLLPTPQIWREYVVYHYFRSHQWCVRSGVKFGVDWLLYRKGPPFQHAEFAIMVLDNQAERSWAWLHSNMRVVSSAKKTLMFVYVEGPRSMPDWSDVGTVQQFRDVLSEYTVKAITFSRFAPSRNRD